MRGLGDLHMRAKLEKMKQQYKMEVSTKPPKIPYRETHHAARRGPLPPQEADRRRGTVRRGVPARSSRCRAARASSSSSEVKGGVIPNVFIPAVEKGVRQALDHGVDRGLPGRRHPA